MSSRSHLPPVPPESTSPKGPGDTPRVDPKSGAKQAGPGNVDKQGQQGNSKVNTTNQGYQQDR